MVRCHVDVGDVNWSFISICEACDIVQVLMEPLFAALFDLPIFHVHEQAGSTRWARLSECMLDCMRREDPDTRSLVISTLLAAGVAVAVDIQPHLVLALGAFGKHAPETVSPALVRDYLRQSLKAYENLPRPSKLRILSFILKEEDFWDVEGIHLLPLLDGSFIQFSGKKTADRVYLPTQELSAELLPGLEKLLVCTTDVDEFLQDKLRKIAQSGKVYNAFVMYSCHIVRCTSVRRSDTVVQPLKACCC